MNYVTPLKCRIIAFICKICFRSRYSKSLQKKFLKQLLSYVREHNRYFNSLLQGKKITANNALETLKSLPLLSKDIIYKQGNNIYNDNIKGDWKRWRNTGGSTGTPLKFPVYYLKSFFFDKELIHQA